MFDSFFLLSLYRNKFFTFRKMLSRMLFLKSKNIFFDWLPPIQINIKGVTHLANQSTVIAKDPEGKEPLTQTFYLINITDFMDFLTQCFISSETRGFVAEN